MRRYFSYLLHSQGIRQTVITVVGNIASAGVAAVAIILFSRALGPSLFGEFSVGISIVTIISILNEAGSNTALIKLIGAATKQAQKNYFFSLTLLFRLTLTVVIVGGGLLITPFLIQWLKLSHPSIVIASFLLGVSTIYYEYVIVTLQSVHAFTQAVYINAIQAIAKFLGGVVLFALGLKNIMLAYTWYVGAPFIAIALSRFFIPTWIHIKPKVTADNFSAINSKIVPIVKHSAFAMISAGIVDPLSVLLVQGFFTSFETGIFGGAQRIALIFSLIAASLADVLFPRVAKYKKKNDLRAYMKKAVILCGLAFLGLATILPFTKWLLILTIGPQYSSGLLVLRILLSSVFFQIATIPMMAFFYSFAEDWYFSVIGILQLLIMVIGNFLFVPSYGLIAAATVRLVTRIIVFLFTTGAAFYLYRQNTGAHRGQA